MIRHRYNFNQWILSKICRDKKKQLSSEDDITHSFLPKYMAGLQMITSFSLNSSIRCRVNQKVRHTGQGYPQRNRKIKTTYTRYKLGRLYGLLRQEKDDIYWKIFNVARKMKLRMAAICAPALSATVSSQTQKKNTFNIFSGLMTVFWA